LALSSTNDSSVTLCLHKNIRLHRLDTSHGSVICK
jgi:hypothetical protein